MNILGWKVPVMLVKFKTWITGTKLETYWLKWLGGTVLGWYAKRSAVRVPAKFEMSLRVIMNKQEKSTADDESTLALKSMGKIIHSPKQG